MSFIETMHENLSHAGARALIIEVHGKRLVETRGSQLQDLVARGRGFLAARGVKPGHRVALIAHNSARWAAADLAILGAGAVCVPMYDRQAPSELAGMLADCEPVLVLVDAPGLKAALEAAWSPLSLSVFQGERGGEEGRLQDRRVVLLEELFGHAPGELRPVARPGSDWVTMIYTSGTSGEPKGVLYTVDNVDFMLARTTERLQEMVGERSGEDRVFHYLPFCFAGSRIQLWSQLTRANPLMVSTDLNNLVEELGSAQPHYFLNVPTLLERIKTGVEGKLRDQGGVIHALYAAAVQAARRASQGRLPWRDQLALALGKHAIFPRIRAQIGRNLEFLICGSAPLNEDTQRWFSAIGVPVYQVYGLTETTAIVTMDRKGLVTPGCVGRAVEGVELKLSAEGELLCRGPNIFPGYWKRPEATARCLRDGWFHTGDMAELSSQGDLRIVGRLKDLLVPESGHNVAPGPIEQRLSSLCGGSQVMLVGHARPYLSAIVSGNVTRDQVQGALEQLNAQLPHYRRVRRFFIAPEPFTVDNGLLTANQKLKRKAVEERYEPQIEELYT